MSNMSDRFGLSVGKLLIAEPFMLDSVFKRSVILLCQDEPEKSLGFILNKPSDFSLSDSIDDFPDFNVPIYFGGPIETSTIHYIHTLGEKLEDSFEIQSGIYWGGDYENLSYLIQTGKVKENEIRFFAGHTAWEENQLYDEVKKRNWFLGNCKKEFTFTDEPYELWGKALRSIGSKFAGLARFRECPSLN